jgi:hypothetical protein
VKGAGSLRKCKSGHILLLHSNLNLTYSGYNGTPLEKLSEWKVAVSGSSKLYSKIPAGVTLQFLKFSF